MLTVLQLYIVGYVGVTLENGPLLLMKYVRGGNLAAAWRIKGEPWWHPMHIAQVLCQCLHALRYLHAKPTVVHRDIKPENILVEHRFPWPLIKICDFGLAKEGSKVDGKAGTWTYTAPEVLSGMFIPQQSSSNQHRHPSGETHLGAGSSNSAPMIVLCARFLTPRVHANF